MDAKLPKNSEIDLLANLSGVLYYVVLSFTSLNFMTIDVDGKCEKSPNCYNFIVYILASYICNQGTVKKNTLYATYSNVIIAIFVVTVCFRGGGCECIEFKVKNPYL